MREYLEQATQDIAVGLDPDVVINALLVEKSPWRPGKLTGLGAAAYGAYKGYKANKEAKEKGLKGKERAKHVAKAAAVGAAKGAATGYGVQIAYRSYKSSAARKRHHERRKGSFWTSAKTGKKGEGATYYRGTGKLNTASEKATQRAKEKAIETARKIRRRARRQSKVEGTMGAASELLNKLRGK